jgi:hypothetical protein
MRRLMKRGVPKLQLEADSQLDEGTSEEATYTFNATSMDKPKKPMHT